MIKILLADNRFRLDEKKLKSLAAKVLKSESRPDGKLNIVYCNDRLITGLNTRYLNKRRATDVLAFDLNGTKAEECQGEIYINLQQAKRQARQVGVNYGEEVQRLTIHGILHILGYDDTSEASRRKMWNRQESYLNKWKK